LPAALAATIGSYGKTSRNYTQRKSAYGRGAGAQAGDKAPDFHAVDDSLKPVDLATTGNTVRIFSVVPSLDTPVCDMQTKRFNEEAGKLPDLKIYNVSMDLPFAQKRWCGAFGVDHIKMISDHRDGSFGEHYGTLIKDLRIMSARFSWSTRTTLSATSNTSRKSRTIRITNPRSK